MIRDQVLLISCFVGGRAGSSRAAAHLINADLTGHAAAAADSHLPAAPAATEKTFSRVTTPHRRDFRISYVINSDLSQSGHLTQPVVQLAGEFCHVPCGLKITSILSFLTAASGLGTCTIIVICHVLMQTQTS